MSAILFAILGGALAGHLTAKAYDEYADPVMEERHADRVEEYEEAYREEARAEARRRRFEALANASNGGYPPYGTQPQMPTIPTYTQVPQMPVVPQTSAELMGWQAAQNSIAALQQQLMQKQTAQPVPPVAPMQPAAPAQAAPQAQPAPAAPAASVSDAALVQVLQQLNQRLAAVEQLSNLVTEAIAEEAAADANTEADNADDIEVIQPEENQKRDSKGRFAKK